MTIHLSSADVRALADDALAIDAVRRGFAIEAAGDAVLPVRIDVNSSRGFFRTMPAVLGDRMGCKIMTLVRGSGNHYLVLLFDVESGALLATVDGSDITKIRTVATTTLAAEAMLTELPDSLSLLGTGFEARGHLEFLARRWPLGTVHVYSRNPENRERFAAEMSTHLGIDVKATTTAEDAAAQSQVVLLATKSPTAVVDGNAFLPGSTVLSIGSTRLDLRELDRAAFARAAVVVVDALDQVTDHSGDVVEALATGAMSSDGLLPMGLLLSGAAVMPPLSEARDLNVLKTAGTALQDLALADAVYAAALAQGAGRDLGTIAEIVTAGGG
jgi:alanine dehydrogenase